MYRAPSGALRVRRRHRPVGVGPRRLATRTARPPDRNMQQATVNLFADMGAQPGDAASRPDRRHRVDRQHRADVDDHVARGGTTVADGAQVTITGTASDTGGGVVAGVEVSTDGGTTWHPATGHARAGPTRGSPTATRRTTVKVARRRRQRQPARRRAPGVHGQRQLPVLAVGHERHAPARTSTPATRRRSRSASSSRPTATARSPACASTRRGQHRHAHRQPVDQRAGRGWRRRRSPARRRSGWQTVTFATPVAVTPGTTYIASYYAPNGHYAATADYLYRNPAPGPNGGAMADSAAAARPPQHRHGRPTASTPTAPSSTFPTNSFGAANYWVDVVFSPLAGARARSPT